MTDKKDDGKRPHATIDLKATEVKAPDPAKPADSKPATEAAAKPSDAKPGDTKSAGATAAKPETAAGQPAGPKADTKTAPAPVPPAARPVKSGGGVGAFFSHLVAGVLGGGLAWFGLTNYGAELGITAPTPPAASSTAALEAKLANLEKTLASKPAVTADAGLAAKVTALESQLTKLDQIAKSVTDLSAGQTKLATETKALDSKTAGLSGDQGPAARVAKLEQQLKLMSDAAEGNPQPGKLPQIAALAGRVVDLEATVNNQISAMRKTVSQELEQRLALTNETSEAAKSGANRVDREVAALKSDAAAATQKLDKLRSDSDRLSSAVQSIRDTSNDLKNGLDAVKSDIDAKFKSVAKPADVAAAVAPVTGKLASLEQNVQSVVKAEDDRKTSAERIVLSLELANLKRVVDRGQKYTAELDQVKKAGAKTDLTVLERYKDSGIPTIADLTRDFSNVSPTILDAAADKGDGSIVGRVIASARSAIAVRKINYAADDKSAEAVVGRIEKALHDGNVQTALDEAKNIPAAAAGDQGIQNWLVKVEARGAVDRAITALEASLKSSLTGTPAPAKDPAK